MMYLGKDPVGLATSIPEFGDNVQIEYGEYISNNDILATDVVFSHNLGVQPDFFLIQEIDIDLNNTYSKKYLLYSIFMIFSLTQGTLITRCLDSNGSYAAVHAASEVSSLSKYCNESQIQCFGQGTNTYLKANTKYHYIIGKYKEVTLNANE